jgi:hypothetical protein
MGRLGTVGPGIRTNGLPKKEDKSAPNRVKTKPMAIWDPFRVSEPKATIPANSAPTAAAAKKPNTKLPVSLATANPTMAASMIVPSAERLITPARSVMVSPTQAKTTGVAVAMAVERIATSWAAVIMSLSRTRVGLTHLQLLRECACRSGHRLTPTPRA